MITVFEIQSSIKQAIRIIVDHGVSKRDDEFKILLNLFYTCF